MKTIQRWLCVLTAATMSAAVAHAGTVSVLLDNSDQSGAPGALLRYFGIITNTSSGTVFLNGDDPNLAAMAGDFSVDDSAFFNNAPLSLDAGDSSLDIELFDVTVSNPFTDTFAAYAGLYTVMGGVDGGAQDILTDPPTEFSVTLISATPEPATLVLLGSGLMICAMLRRRAVRTTP